MSNRLLSLFILILIFGGLYGGYYYFFIANVGKLSVILSGADNVSVTIESEFKKSYDQTCKKVCQFNDIPPVSYLLHAKKDGYVSVEKTFDISRGQSTKLLIRMDKEITLKNLDTKSDITPIATPTIEGNQIDGITDAYAIRDTANRDIKLVTSASGVFTYSLETQQLVMNPLYDDILPLPSGDLIVLVKKTSKDKLSLLSLESTSHDYVLLVNIANKSRKVLLQSEKDGRNLEYHDKKLVLVDTDGNRYEIENAE